MTSNRANFHNSISADFLEAAYAAGDLELARKVNGSLKKDLDQQMAYYRSLGDEDMNNQQLAMQAAGVLNNKGGELSNKQRTFAYDILSTYQILEQLKQWEQEYKVSPGAGGVELGQDTLKKPLDTVDVP